MRTKLVTTGERLGLVVGWLCLPLLAQGCIGLPYGSATKDYEVPDHVPEELYSRTVAVLPFTGHPAYDAPAGEWFAYNLARRQIFTVLSPTQLELRLADQGSTTPAAWRSPSEAAAIGLTVGADYVACGQISLEGTLLGAKAVCDLSILETEGGGEVHAFKTTRNIILFYTDNHHYLMRAVRKAAEEFVVEISAGEDAGEEEQT